MQRFAKYGTTSKNAQNQNYPQIPPKEKKVRKTNPFRYPLSVLYSQTHFAAD